MFSVNFLEGNNARALRSWPLVHKGVTAIGRRGGVTQPLTKSPTQLSLLLRSCNCNLDILYHALAAVHCMPSSPSSYREPQGNLSCTLAPRTTQSIIVDTSNLAGACIYNRLVWQPGATTATSSALARYVGVLLLNRIAFPSLASASHATHVIVFLRLRQSPHGRNQIYIQTILLITVSICEYSRTGTNAAKGPLRIFCQNNEAISATARLLIRH